MYGSEPLEGLEIEGLDIPSGPIRGAAARLVRHLEVEGRLDIDHETLVQLLLRAADAIDKAGPRSVYALPGLMTTFREVRAELLEVTDTSADQVSEFDVILLQPVAPTSARAVDQLERVDRAS